MEQRRRCDWAALTVTIAALLIQVIAVSLPFWQWTDVYEYITVNTTRLSHSYVQGLWTICDLENGYSSCWHPSESRVGIHVVRALETTSMLLLFLVAIFLTVYLSCFSRNLFFRIILIALLCICVILILAGVILFGLNAEDGYLHIACAFSALAAVLALIAAVLLLVMLLCEKSRNNKIVMNEDRAKQTVLDNKAQTKAVEKHRHRSQAGTASPTMSIYMCGERGKLQSKGPFVDRSTSMLSFHSGKVHPSTGHRPDTVTRSTCMTPFLGITNQYRHRTSPIYCGQITPEGRFGADLELHGPCPHSLLCCKCQHQFPKKKTKIGCDCIIGDINICDKCRDKHIRQEGEAYGQNHTSVEARPILYGNEATPNTKYVEKQQGSQFVEARPFFYGNETTPKTKYVKKQQGSQSRKSIKESVSQATPADNDVSSEDKCPPSNHNNDEDVKTNLTEQSKDSGLSIKKDIIEEEPRTSVVRDSDRQKQNTLSYDDHHLVEQNTNEDVTPRVVGQYDTINTDASVTTSNKNPAEQSRKETRHPTKKAAKTRKSIQSRYAFDKSTGTLPHYTRSDKNADCSNEKDEPTNRPKSDVGRSGSPVLTKSKRKNPPKKWDPPKWN